MQRETRTETTNPHRPIDARPSPAMSALRGELDRHDRLCAEVQDLCSGPRADRVAELRSDLACHVPAVSFLGQIKAGKTALLNAFVRMPRLLPSDVNPWTSVITTLHVNAPHPRGAKAEFSFFEREDWDALMGDGGRLGRMADRLGADDEAAEIRRQVEAVREASRARLGANYELILGQKHKFDYFDRALIERYVCLGDGYSPEGDRQGRFADVTRSADIYVEAPHLPLGVELRDTPGVNDPFLVREQVTLRSLDDAALCVVVLSAVQALNSVDLALIQLLASMDRRDVLIFVNRIDELDDPAAQIDEIRASLSATLRQFGVAGRTTLAFGSALWAEAALDGTLEELPEDSLAALFALARDRGLDGDATSHVEDETLAWSLSGLPDLEDLIGRALHEGALRDQLDRSVVAMRNFVAQSRLDIAAQLRVANGTVRIGLDADAVEARVARLADEARTAFLSGAKDLMTAVRDRMNAEARSFAGDLLVNLRTDRKRGRDGAFQCDPIELRIRLKDSYRDFSDGMDRHVRDVLGRAGDDLMAVWQDMVGDLSATLRIDLPDAPAAPPPTPLGRTIVIDMRASWLPSWIQRHLGTDRLEEKLKTAIATEIATVIDEISQQQVVELIRRAQAVLNAFLADQGEALQATAGRDHVGTAELYARLGLKERLDHGRRAMAVARELERIEADLGAAATKPGPRPQKVVSHAV